jgi:hypothetical protein
LTARPSFAQLSQHNGNKQEAKIEIRRVFSGTNETLIVGPTNRGHCSPYFILFLQAPVAGNEADMDVDTNTPRNGLHFWLTQLFFAAFFFFGRRLFVLQTVGMLASMFAQLELTLLFFFFSLFFRSRGPISQ